MPPKILKKISKTGEVESQLTSTSKMANTELIAELPAASGAATLDPALRQVIEEITGNISSVISQKVDILTEMLKSQATEIKVLVGRITDAEDRIAAQEDGLDQATARIKKLEKETLTMAQRIDDIENRGRRKNIRVLGLKEGVEAGPGALKFLEKWLPEFLGVETKSGRIKLERAHRTLAPQPGLIQRPRPMLIRFHNYRDQQQVLEAARRAGSGDQPLMYQNSKIMFFQDFSADTMRRRKGFDAVKRRLREAGIQYSLLYPARLRIIRDGVAKIFNSPMEFMDSLG
uniref:L1 transposable element RRM domain-containing protein n=1 Tax=Poecilia formosa TaxID=48698 RepID=A0A087YRZ4_POEFO